MASAAMRTLFAWQCHSCACSSEQFSPTTASLGKTFTSVCGASGEPLGRQGKKKPLQILYVSLSLTIIIFIDWGIIYISISLSFLLALLFRCVHGSDFKRFHPREKSLVMYELHGSLQREVTGLYGKKYHQESAPVEAAMPAKPFFTASPTRSDELRLFRGAQDLLKRKKNRNT